MSETPQPKSRRSAWRYALYVAGIWILLLLGGPEILDALLQIGFHLALGFLFFLRQTMGQVAFDAGSLLSFLIGLGVATVCMHVVMVRFMRQRSSGESSWRWKWTFCLVAAPLLFFGICVSIQGAVTATGWFLSEPTNAWYSNRGPNKAWAARLVYFGKDIVAEWWTAAR